MKALRTCHAVWGASLLAVLPVGAGLHDDSLGAAHPMAFASWSTGELRLVDATLRVPDLLAPEIQYQSLSMLGTLDANWVSPPMVAVVLPKVELWADPDAEVIVLTQSVTRLHFGIPFARDAPDWRRDRGGRFLDPWKIDQSPRTGLGKFRPER